MSSNGFLFLTTLVASAVEAAPIVLAAGVVPAGRSTLIGIGAALIVLAAIVAVLGPTSRTASRSTRIFPS